jgi:hypothetical protein
MVKPRSCGGQTEATRGQTQARAAGGPRPSRERGAGLAVEGGGEEGRHAVPDPRREEAALRVGQPPAPEAEVRGGEAQQPLGPRAAHDAEGVDGADEGHGRGEQRGVVAAQRGVEQGAELALEGGRHARATEALVRGPEALGQARHLPRDGVVEPRLLQQHLAPGKA